MKAGKIITIVIASVASLIVLAAAVAAAGLFGLSKIGSQQNFPPPEGQQAVSQSGNLILFSEASGSSSFLYLQDSSGKKKTRLTGALKGIESEPSFSHDGKFVVYTFADSPNSKSAVWLVGVDGNNPHAISDSDQDALHPVFSPDDTKVFYAVSNFSGHYSPIVRPARHDWDLFSIPVGSGTHAGTVPTQITHESFYDLRSLDATADGLNPGGTKLLISTSGYPIGELIEEFNLDAAGRNKIFQPHVPGESSVGPSYGEARFIHDGMEILFLAATDTSGGDYDYNIYSMSDVTGAEIKQLTHLKGMTKDLRVVPSEKALFENGGAIQLLDLSTQTVKPI
ncbi:MAG: hypothetical protein ABSG10_00155 [Terracidiphilus sp.]|jgi:hypothetical protein